MLYRLLDYHNFLCENSQSADTLSIVMTPFERSHAELRAIVRLASREIARLPYARCAKC